MSDTDDMRCRDVRLFLRSRHRLAVAGRSNPPHGDGAGFNPQTLFGIPDFDHIMISYNLSMTP
jgi:hypothetical protein